MWGAVAWWLGVKAGKPAWQKTFSQPQDEAAFAWCMAFMSQPAMDPSGSSGPLGSRLLSWIPECPSWGRKAHMAREKDFLRVAQDASSFTL